MKLYVMEGQGVWGDVNSHPLPVTVEVIPYVEMGTAELNGKPASICAGKFTIRNVKDGIVSVKVNGIPCESLLCRSANGSDSRVNAIGQDLRPVLPVLSRVYALEETVKRHETQLKQKDFFG